MVGATICRSRDRIALGYNDAGASALDRQGGTTMAKQAVQFGTEPEEPAKREMPFWVQQLHEVAEIASFLFLIAGVIVAVAEYVAHNHESADNARKERVEAADKAYSEIDTRFAEFLKMCVEYPGLDCYSVAADPAKEPPDLPRQRIAYSMLTDVFEVAFTRYH